MSIVYINHHAFSPALSMYRSYHPIRESMPLGRDVRITILGFVHARQQSRRPRADDDRANVFEGCS